MKKNIQEFDLESLLLNDDFCDWARSGKVGFDEYIADLTKKHPQYSKSIQDAVAIIRALNEDQLQVPIDQKIKIWEKCTKKARSKKTHLLQFFKYAAVFAVASVLTATTYYLLDYNQYDQYMSNYRVPEHSETKLIIGNQKEIEIQTDESDIVFSKDGTQVKVDGKKHYNIEKQEKPTYNQIVVPYGRKTKIILPDSSQVWLNSGSRLVYSTRFDEKTRLVFLEGEGFFDVAKDQLRPFVVKTNQLAVKAIGTSFNIKAYHDEPTEEAILATGLVSVEFRDKLFNNKTKIKPNQKVSLSKQTKDYKISEVNVEDYVSWINGMFIFQDETIDAVLKRVSRYYNIEILLTNELLDRRISGKLDLKENYINVLETLTLISNASYDIEDNKIYFRINK